MRDTFLRSVFSLLVVSCGICTTVRESQPMVSQQQPMVSQQQPMVSLLCKEVAAFLPDMCSYKMARSRCRDVCKSGANKSTNNRGSLQCGRRPQNAPVRLRAAKPFLGGHRHRQNSGSTHRNKQDGGKRGLTASKRIVGGNNSSPGEWSWMVELRKNGEHNCGGAILSKYFILTAAHCFDESKRSGDWEVVAGDHSLLQEEVFNQVIPVKNIFVHEKFSQRKEDGMPRNDIAIVQLKNAIKLADTNKGSICLPDPGKPISDNRFGCYVTGWGRTSYEGAAPPELHHAKVYTVPSELCNRHESYDGHVNGTQHVCAGYDQGGVDACQGDSGGPLACYKEGRWYANGIVSIGYKCAVPKKYGLYTRVTTFIEWMLKYILQ